MCVLVNGVDIRKRKRSPSSSDVVHREKRGSPGKVKETPEQIQFKQLIKEIAIVLTLYMARYPTTANVSGDSDPSVLRYPLPAPSEISVSPNGKRTTKLESTERVRTIASKLEANEYANLNQLEVIIFLARPFLMVRMTCKLRQKDSWTSFPLIPNHTTRLLLSLPLQ